ncbi:MAG: hypothetical protein M3160_10620, partial [Candidatus Eremiobacteraeota bacterium]|nr:hypothetical protein [Candidatus Eremiobacteraeota bacterium]
MAAEAESDLKLEIAHVLTIDVVAYSTLLIHEQGQVLGELNKIVRNAPCFRSAEAAHKLTPLPTGDGMALVFFDDPEAPLECAMQITSELKKHPKVRVRMGIHSGPINQILDVNDRSNVAGAGIDMAQRVMDCGDAGHILLSKRVADDLAPYTRWHRHLYDLGECQVKHGRKISVFNFYTDDLGNSAVPDKLRDAQHLKHEHADAKAGMGRRWPGWVRIGTVFLAAVLFALAIWMARGGAGKPPERSVAVLPFENRSDEKANAYFADGIQDEILTRLSKIAALKVISRTSTRYLESAPRNLRDIGRELGVAHIVEGSVQKIGK